MWRPDASAPAIIVAAGLILAWHTWARWGDIQVACGKELYVPLEILRGKLLYRDVAYLYGPLAPYMLALLIGSFGRHLSMLYWFGIAVGGGCALLLYQIGMMLEERAAGLAAALVLLFRGFYPNQADYPFPYTYGTPLALLLSLLCTWRAVAYLLGRPRGNLTLAGLAAGFAVLSKPEFGASCYTMLLFIVIADSAFERSVRTLLRDCSDMFVPGLLAAGEEDKYIADLVRAAPDYMILANERTETYGESYFGLDYDRKVYDWITRNYRIAGEFGDFRRKRDAPLAAVLYLRRTRAATPPRSAGEDR